jgi:two-component system nitrogen regulation response regulator NtrX
MPTVVLVEDDRDLRDLLCEILREHGFTVIAVRDALEAVASTREVQDAPALMLLDRRIAQGAESAMIEWVRSFSRLHDLPVVLFSATGSLALDVSSRESLREAFDADLLLAIVEGIFHTPH